MRSSNAHKACTPARLRGRALLSALCLTLGVAGTARAASIVPSESFCLHGCDLPSIEELDQGREIPLTIDDNPLRLIAPFQDYIGEIEDDGSKVDSDSEWRSPRNAGPRQ